MKSISLPVYLQYMRYFALIFIFIAVQSSTYAQTIKEHYRDFKIIADMMDSVKNQRYVRFNLKAIERIESGFSMANSKVKLQCNPRKVYLINPEKRLEVLFNDGYLNNKCLVKPHVFPYFTLTLDPRGNLMRKNQHFTIHEIGFEFTVKTIAIALSKEKDQIAKHLTYMGKAEKNNMKCHLLIYENNAFSYFDHIVQAKETVATIANKYVVNDYMVRTKNDLYNDYSYLKIGSKVKIPNFYCKKAIFYVDEKTMLPISISIFDEVGLFESYDFTELEVNKTIPATEFTRNFKDYDF